MAKKRCISVRLSRQRIEALLQIYEDINQHFKPINDHHHLLYAFLGELQHKLSLLYRKVQADYTLTLTTTEAIAFYQLCQEIDLSQHSYGHIILSAMLQQMEQAA